MDFGDMDRIPHEIRSDYTSEPLLAPRWVIQAERPSEKICAKRRLSQQLCVRQVPSQPPESFETQVTKCHLELIGNGIRQQERIQKITESRESALPTMPGEQQGMNVVARSKDVGNRRSRRNRSLEDERPIEAHPPRKVGANMELDPDSTRRVGEWR